MRLLWLRLKESGRFTRHHCLIAAPRRMRRSRPRSTRSSTSLFSIITRWRSRSRLRPRSILITRRRIRTRASMRRGGDVPVCGCSQPTSSRVWPVCADGTVEPGLFASLDLVGLATVCDVVPLVGCQPGLCACRGVEAFETRAKWNQGPCGGRARWSRRSRSIIAVSVFGPRNQRGRPRRTGEPRRGIADGAQRRGSRAPRGTARSPQPRAAGH